MSAAAILLGTNILSAVNLTANAESVSDIAVLDYSEKKKNNIEDLLENNKGVIYVRNQGVAVPDEDDESNEEGDSIQSLSFGEYYYKGDDGSIHTNDFYGTAYTDNEQLLALIDKVKGYIYDETSGIEAYSDESVTIGIGNAWTSINTTRTPMSMDYNGVHYGDYLEWSTTYYLDNGDDRFYAVAKQCYITPNSSTPYSLTDSLTVWVKVPSTSADDGLHVYAYLPQMTGASTTVNEGIQVGASTESGFSANINISASRSIESPYIKPQGNISKDIVETLYTYAYPTSIASSDTRYYDYGHNESMQPFVCVFHDEKTDKNRATKGKSTISIMGEAFGGVKTFVLTSVSSYH